ncbi:hypothetical protein LTR37_007782 [Vermiconidia calcicola]|uniref:Uncharacterized protein n=1 Tax=Vermiconidia calcicola TaxID=1690605 RepID=A0ACC3NCJ7_9PEZI|nr:hypothetical protein LTR37_007782 [Vermiconidia calcicola]
MTELASSRIASRPLPLRTYSESEAPAGAGEDAESAQNHSRGKSAYLPSGNRRLSVWRPTHYKKHKSGGGSHQSSLPAVPELGDTKLALERTRSNLLSPPITPSKDSVSENSAEFGWTNDVPTYDFSRIDYELDRTRIVGTGLWSIVYFAQPVVRSPTQHGIREFTRPTTPRRRAAAPCSFFAVKVAARPDARDVFLHEAKMLGCLQKSSGSEQYIVPFYGLDYRMFSLVCEGVLGGSLESVSTRLKVMTELERHLELRALFPELASNLISGLRFIHSAGVVHADIKPANVLLDISTRSESSDSVIRARYIDFSASFVSDQGVTANAGGTWDYMAPEQLRIQKDLNTPIFASDVWSLGMTLLSIIVGGSPYAAACGSNVFMLREAIKTGDALRFARADPVVQKRMAACQDFVDCCRLALQKDPARRSTTAAWERWFEVQEME